MKLCKLNKIYNKMHQKKKNINNYNLKLKIKWIYQNRINKAIKIKFFLVMIVKENTTKMNLLNLYQEKVGLGKFINVINLKIKEDMYANK